jgi:hypothetical protein
VPPEQEHRDAAACQFVAALRGAMAAANYPVTMVGETMAAVGVQTGLLLWRAAIQLTSSPNRRPMHD